MKPANRQFYRFSGRACSASQAASADRVEELRVARDVAGLQRGR
jgi:hypothetical protein